MEPEILSPSLSMTTSVLVWLTLLKCLLGSPSFQSLTWILLSVHAELLLERLLKMM